MSHRASGMPADPISIPNGRKANGISHLSPSPANVTPPVSVSPTLSSNLHARLGRQRQHSIHQVSSSQSNDNVLQPRVLRLFATSELRLLLLENISQGPVQLFSNRAFRSTITPRLGLKTSFSKRLDNTMLLGFDPRPVSPPKSSKLPPKNFSTRFSRRKDSVVFSVS